MKTIKLLPLAVAITGSIATLSSYAATPKFTTDTVISSTGTSSYTSTPQSSNNTSGFYLSGQLGAQLTGSNLNTTWVSKDPNASVNNDFHTGGRAINLLGGAALGYQADNNLRFELAYNDDLNDHSIKNYNHYTQKTPKAIINAMKTSQADTSLKTIMANAYYTFDTGSNFSPFIMAGLGVAHVNASGTENDTGSDAIKSQHLSNRHAFTDNDAMQLARFSRPEPSDSLGASDSFSSLGTVSGEKNNFAWNVGVGGSYQVAPNLYIDGMVSYLDAGKVNLTGTAQSKNNAGAIADFTTHSNLKVNAVNMLLDIRYVF